MFELIELFLRVLCIVFALIYARKAFNEVQASRELEKKKLLALVNLREAISKLNDDLVNLEVDCLFKK